MFNLGVFRSYYDCPAKGWQKLPKLLTDTTAGSRTSVHLSFISLVMPFQSAVQRILVTRAHDQPAPDWCSTRPAAPVPSVSPTSPSYARRARRDTVIVYPGPKDCTIRAIRVYPLITEIVFNIYRVHRPRKQHFVYFKYKQYGVRF